MDSILFIRTGGTIDSEPYPDAKQPPKLVKTLPTDKSLVLPLIQSMCSADDVDTLDWTEEQEARFVKDSAEFTEDDMRIIATIITASPHRTVLITHGTNHMASNAKRLNDVLGTCDRVVVFAGAMVPLSMRDRFASDGEENLRYALDHMSAMPSGVYVTGWDMDKKQRRFFAPHTVEKDNDASLAHLTLTFKAKE